jgi:polyisoprenyl-teichoic acid--peptidoglycan teichoic acid transferase
VKLIPSTRGGALWRFALGAFIVIGFTAATTAVAGLLQFKQLASYISATPAIKHANITIPNPGDPQTILVVGSDHRAGTPFRSANTDTMMLIRLDPRSSTINVLSIPRDLKVDVPGEGIAKINSAYSVGGPNLLIRTIRRNVFPGLRVSHIIDINFGGFEALVNSIGCVYADVDHRYYNNTAFTDYSSINLQPGYQKLCGPQALSFVRFRHTDSDIVRNARQQDFVRWAKQQYSQDQLISKRDALVRIFGKHAQTDQNLHTTDGLINLFNLVAFMDGHTVRQIAFPAQIQPCGGGGVNGVAVAACYVTGAPGAERRVFTELMTPTVSRPAPAAPPGGARAGRRRPSGRSDLSSDLADGRAQASALRRRAGLPVYYPRVVASGSSYCSDLSNNCYVETGAGTAFYPRAYRLRDHGHRYAAYRMTLEINPLLGEYYGIQGMTWQDPPILGKPSFSRLVNGKLLYVYMNGGKVSVVAWHATWGVYWVSNTLTDTLSPHQMIGIAASLTRG